MQGERVVAIAPRIAQPNLNSARLVFIDETWVKTNMARPYGQAPRGQRLVASVPHGHWTTSTFLTALRHDAIIAPCAIDGPINGRDVHSLCRAVPGSDPGPG